MNTEIPKEIITTLISPLEITSLTPNVSSPLKDGDGNPLIKFSDVKHSEILPPLPQAHFTNTQYTEIALHVLILIASNNKNDYTIIGKQFPVEDKKLKIVVQYTDTVATENYYVPYMLKFTIEKDVSSDIKEIEVFLENEDPKTSRGTITTVTPPTRDNQNS